MTPELLITLVVSLITATAGVVGGGLGVAWLNRDKTRADAAGTLTESTIKLLNELQEERASNRADMAAIREENARLRTRVDNFDQTIEEIRRINDERISRLEAEIEIQGNAIENLNAENLKLQAVIKVYVRQLWERGIEPIIDPDKIGAMTVEELNRILAGYVSIDRRRAAARQEENDL